MACDRRALAGRGTAGSSRSRSGCSPASVYTIRRDPHFFSYVRAQLVAAYGEVAREAGRAEASTRRSTARQQAVARARSAKTLDRRGDPAAAVVSIDPRNGAISALASRWSTGTGCSSTSPARAPARPAPRSRPSCSPMRSGHARRPEHDVCTSPRPSRTSRRRGRSRGRPHTYENAYFGPETLTKATLLSDNVVFAKLTLDVGPRKVAHVAHLLGVHSKLPAGALDRPRRELGHAAHARLRVRDPRLGRRLPPAVRDPEGRAPGREVDHAPRGGGSEAGARPPEGRRVDGDPGARAERADGTGIATQIPGVSRG